VLGFWLLAVSAVLLIAGAELFAENAAAAARRMRITVFGAAFLLAGAEPEEMITAAIASGPPHLEPFGRNSMRITQWPSHITTPRQSAETSNTKSMDATQQCFQGG
jgi:hypothetical protein